MDTDTNADTCEKLVKNFIKCNIGIDATDILFDRAHRLGNPNKSKLPRPIVVKFHYFHDKQRILNAAIPLRGDMKKKNQGVGSQLPKEWRDARQKLSTVYQAEKLKGSTLKYVGENLIINGTVYKPPPSIHP